MLTQSTIRNLADEAERLRGEREEIASRLAALDRQLNLVTELVMLYRESTDDVEDTIQPPKTLRNELVAIFREAGTPLHYKEAYQRLLERGFTVNGTDPAKNVGAQLSNDERFEKRGNGLWGLVAWRNRPPIVPASEGIQDAVPAAQPVATASAPIHQPSFALPVTDEDENEDWTEDPWDVVPPEERLSLPQGGDIFEENRG